MAVGRWTDPSAGDIGANQKRHVWFNRPRRVSGKHAPDLWYKIRFFFGGYHLIILFVILRGAPSRPISWSFYSDAEKTRRVRAILRTAEMIQPGCIP